MSSLSLSIHLSFNSQKGPPLSSLSDLTYHSLCVGVAEVGGVGRSVVNHRLVYGVGRLVGEYTGGEAGHHLDRVFMSLGDRLTGRTPPGQSIHGFRSLVDRQDTTWTEYSWL